MNKIFSRFLVASLLGGTALATTVSLAATGLEAKTSWAISRVASAAQGSYCTMAQKFDNGTVFTVAKNSGNEYSLAFDFQSPKFKAGEPIAVSLKAGAGSTQSYEVSPQTPEAFVIGLGADDSMIADLAKSGKIQLDAAGESYTFNTAKFDSAQQELTTCMSSMKPAPTREAKAEEDAPTDAASLEASEKKSKGKPAADVKAEAKAKTAPKSEEQAGLRADDLIAAPIDSAEMPSARELAEVRPAGAAEEEALKSENQRLKQTLSDARRAYENQISAQSGPAIPELQEKLRVLELENANLKEDRANRAEAEKKNAKTKDETPRLTAELEKARQDIATASEQNKALQAELAAARQAQRDVQTLKAENQTLKNQAEIAAQSEKQAEKLTPMPVPTGNANIPADLQKKLAALQSENASLKAQLNDAQDAGMPSMAAAGSAGNDDSLRDQIRDLKSQLEIVESENSGLRAQMANLQSETEKGQLKAAGGSWDIEQATRRYQESQREIRRLGAILEQDRVKCAQEKKDIEYMLFDPEVAKPAQITMLNSLEDQIVDKDAKIAELEKTMKSGVDQSAQIEQLKFDASQKAARIAELEGNLKKSSEQVAAAEKLKQDAAVKDATIAQLEAGLKQTQAQVAEATKLKQDAAVKDTAIVQLQAQAVEATKLKQDMAVKDAALTQMQAQMAEASKLKQDAAVKDARIAQLETALRVAQVQPAAGSAATSIDALPVPTATAQPVALAASVQPSQPQPPVPAMQIQPMNAQAAAVPQSAQPQTMVQAAALQPQDIAPAPQPAQIQPAAYAAPPVQQVAPVAVAPSVRFQSQQDFASMLQRAGVGVRGQVQPVAKATSDSYKAYSWQTDSLYGSAEQRVMASQGGFQPAVQQYIDRAKSRCRGDFAAVPAQIAAPNGGQAEGYEIACVSGQSGSSASVLFTYSDGIMTTVAHEGRAEAMDIAMDARDKVAAKFGTN